MAAVMERETTELDRAEVGEVTDMMRAFANAYVTNGANATKAAESAGYAKTSARVLGYKLTLHPAVRALIHAEQEQRLVNRAATIAIDTLIEIMQDRERTSSAVRVEASKTVLDRAGHLAKGANKQDDNAPKALNDMTVDELDAFITAGAKAVEKARDSGAIQGSATVVPEDNPQDGAQALDVTPSNQ